MLGRTTCFLEVVQTPRGTPTGTEAAWPKGWRFLGAAENISSLNLELKWIYSD